MRIERCFRVVTTSPVRIKQEATSMPDPEPPDLIYDGTSYRLHPDTVAELLQRGVVVAGEPGGPPYELSIEHTIDELEALADVVIASEAPPQSRLRVERRNAGFSTGRFGFLTRKDDISIEDEPRG
jgi:hypothetical protein